ncbi:uncharacterized protein LOC117229547 [Megalopta genalis]|uniref:uncharacterized protein LOC117229547 n=1 Tax=Megalopta genalis TaxID=115081 RepID=UPI003FD3DF5E
MSYAGAAFVALGVAFVSFLMYYMSGEREQEQQYHQSYSNGRERQISNSSYNDKKSSCYGNSAQQMRDKLRTENCTICLEPLCIGLTAALHCNHMFHTECIIRWRTDSNQQSCPICRKRFTSRDPVH